MEVVDGSQVIPLGSQVKLGCVRGFLLLNSVDSIPALCNCNGQLNISNDQHFCESKNYLVCC